MSTPTQEEFEEAWATYTRLQSDRVLWEKIQARERYRTVSEWTCRTACDP